MLVYPQEFFILLPVQLLKYADMHIEMCRNRFELSRKQVYTCLCCSFRYAGFATLIVKMSGEEEKINPKPSCNPFNPTCYKHFSPCFLHFSMLTPSNSRLSHSCSTPEPLQGHQELKSGTGMRGKIYLFVLLWACSLYMHGFFLFLYFFPFVV